MAKDKIIDEALRRVPDYPKKGILFYDITGILRKPPAFKHCIESIVKHYEAQKLDAIAAIEARGFIFAAPIAERLGIPLILVRKKGKLPGETLECSYELEYGTATVEVHKSDVVAGERILIMDDLIATGGTLQASRSILESAGAEVVGFCGIVGLPFLNYHEKLGDLPIHTLIEYDSE